MEPVYGKGGRVAGIDVHKRMLAVVVADRVDPEQTRKEHKFGTEWRSLRQLREWLQSEQVEEVAMESTAQYWKPVLLELEGHMKVQLAQPRSTTARQGRKSDFRDARRIVKRLLADDLTLSYIPGPEQRLERFVSRARIQLVEDRTRIQNQMECLLEEGRIKLAAVVSDLLGVTSRRLLWALAKGEEQVEEMAALAAKHLEASEEVLRDALHGQMNATHRRLLEMSLRRIESLDRDIEELDRELARLQSVHQEAIERVCGVPGMSLIAAEQTVAEAGVAAAAFPSAGQFASWIGACPGREESAEKSNSNRSPKGNRVLRRVLTQAAWAAVKMKGCVFQKQFQRLVPRLGKYKAIWAVAHKMARLIWKILHDNVSYQERGNLPPDAKSVQRRKQRLTRQLRDLGFKVELTPRSLNMA